MGGRPANRVDERLKRLGESEAATVKGTTEARMLKDNIAHHSSI
jgi:hypothetical protein